MKDNAYVAISLGLLLGVCLLVLIGAAPIQHWLEIPGAEWGAYDSSGNQLFKVRVSDKAFTLNGVLDAGAGIRAHGTINASSQTLTVDTSTARIANAQTIYATGAANALLVNASNVSVGTSVPTPVAAITVRATGAEAMRVYAPAIANASAGVTFYAPNSTGTTPIFCGMIYSVADGDTNYSNQTIRIAVPVTSNPYPVDTLTIKGGNIIIGATTPISGYNLTVNNGIYSGGTVYGAGTISGQTIADRTVGSPDDALSEIQKMKVIGDEIDHTTLGLARSIREVGRVTTVLYDEKTGAEVGSYAGGISEEEKELIPDEIYIDEQKTITQEEERDLSRLASMLTRAVQQLDERITALETKQ